MLEAVKTSGCKDSTNQRFMGVVPRVGRRSLGFERRLFFGGIGASSGGRVVLSVFV